MCVVCNVCTFVGDEYGWHEIAIILAAIKLTANQLEEIVVVMKLIVRLYCKQINQQSYKMIEIFSLVHQFEVDSHHKRNVN